MASKLVYHSKITLMHKKTENSAIAELKIFQVPKDENFPEGLKYSLFLVNLETKKVLVGFDNHKPKGHHLHFRDEESPYKFVDTGKLVEDFWKYVKKEGYKL